MKLKIGDRIRITGVPECECIHADTVKVLKKLANRGTSVRIFEIDEYGSPWYRCRFRCKNGDWEHHHLAVLEGENNWIKVNHRKVKDG